MASSLQNGKAAKKLANLLKLDGFNNLFDWYSSPMDANTSVEDLEIAGKSMINAIRHSDFVLFLVNKSSGGMNIELGASIAMNKNIIVLVEEDIWLNRLNKSPFWVHPCLNINIIKDGWIKKAGTRFNKVLPYLNNIILGELKSPVRELGLWKGWQEPTLHYRLDNRTNPTLQIYADEDNGWISPIMGTFEKDPLQSLDSRTIPDCHIALSIASDLYEKRVIRPLGRYYIRLLHNRGRASYYAEFRDRNGVLEVKNYDEEWVISTLHDSSLQPIDALLKNGTRVDY